MDELKARGAKEIIIGKVQLRAKKVKQYSLDCWPCTRYDRNPDTKHAAVAVMDDVIETGLFA